jgi:hypothetical protein
MGTSCGGAYLTDIIRKYIITDKTTVADMDNIISDDDIDKTHRLIDSIIKNTECTSIDTTDFNNSLKVIRDEVELSQENKKKCVPIMAEIFKKIEIKYPNLTLTNDQINDEIKIITNTLTENDCTILIAPIIKHLKGLIPIISKKKNYLTYK